MMAKKFLLVVLLQFSLSACTMNELLALIVTPTAVPGPTRTFAPSLTPSHTPTVTATLPTATFTLTPTMVVGAVDMAVSPSPNPSVTAPAHTTLFSNPNSIFTSISLSGDQFYWGQCEGPKYVDFSVKVAKNRRVSYVLLFLRLVAKYGTQSTQWGAGAIMEKDEKGLYNYRVTPDTLIHYREFEDAWVQYQIVISNSSRQILGSTQIVQDELSLTHCVPSEATLKSQE